MADNLCQPVDLATRILECTYNRGQKLDRIVTSVPSLFSGILILLLLGSSDHYSVFCSISFIRSDHPSITKQILAPQFSHPGRFPRFFSFLSLEQFMFRLGPYRISFQTYQLCSSIGNSLFHSAPNNGNSIMPGGLTMQVIVL